MQLRRGFSYSIAGMLAAVGFIAPQARAGEADLQCDFVIEVNALRAGSPTVTVGGTKDVTAKARIAKGTAPDGTVIDAMLTIEASDGGVVIDSATTGPFRLGVGGGGRGDKVTLSIPRCTSGFIAFIATFTAVDGSGDPCEGMHRIFRECTR